MTRTVGSELFRACETFSFWEWNEAANTVRETANPRRDKSAWLLPSSSSSEGDGRGRSGDFYDFDAFLLLSFLLRGGFCDERVREGGLVCYKRHFLF